MSSNHGHLRLLFCASYISAESFRTLVEIRFWVCTLLRTIANFVGKPAAIVVGMGFATNSTLIPCLLGKGGLIISDQLNHTSIVQGARCSRAKVKVFKHNDPASLENVIRNAIAEGQPGFEKYKPWNKIVSR